MRYWWSTNPDNHFDWTMENLRKQYPEGVELIPDGVQEENKDHLDDVILRWCDWAFSARKLKRPDLDELRFCLNDIVGARCLAGIYDGKVSFPKWLEGFNLDEDRRIVVVK